MQRQDGERVLVILEAADGDAPGLLTRVKRLVKSLGRTHGVKCVWIQQADVWRFGEVLAPIPAAEVQALALAPQELDPS